MLIICIIIIISILIGFNKKEVKLSQSTIDIIANKELENIFIECLLSFESQFKMASKNKTLIDRTKEIKTLDYIFYNMDLEILNTEQKQVFLDFAKLSYYASCMELECKYDFSADFTVDGIYNSESTLIIDDTYKDYMKNIKDHIRYLKKTYCD